MSTEKSDQEPSMEEILSSIRRIIADDEDDGASAKPARADPAKAKKPEAKPSAASASAAGDDDGEDDDVLDLTQVVEPADVAGKRDRFAKSEPFDSATDEIELEPEPEDDAMEDDEPVSPPPARARPRPARPAVEQAMSDDDTLISSATAARSTGALAKLTRAAASREPAALAHGDKTVETFLVELLRPMLKEWLDANLEGVVERVVEQEVKKLARRAELM